MDDCDHSDRRRHPIIFRLGLGPSLTIEATRELDLTALTWYVCYVMLAALWNNQDFWALLLDPSAIPTLSSRHRSGVATSAPALLYVVLGLLAGAWVTDSAIKKKWTT